MRATDLLEEMDNKTGEPKEDDSKDNEYEKDPKKKKKKDSKKPVEKPGAAKTDFFKKKTDEEPEETLNKSQQLMAEIEVSEAVTMKEITDAQYRSIKTLIAWIRTGAKQKVIVELADRLSKEL